MSSRLDGFSDEELEREIGLRAGRRNKVPTPQPIDRPDFMPLIDTIQYGVAQMQKNNYEDDDFKHYVYEAAIEAVYGKSYWKWRRSQSY